MLKIYKKDNLYSFVLYENQYLEDTISFGLFYDIKDKRFKLLNGIRCLEKTKEKVQLYELTFSNNSILNEIKKKIKKRINFLNKKENYILTRSDFLIILLLQEIEKYEKEILNLNL